MIGVEPGPATVSSNLRVTIPAIATLRNITQIEPSRLSVRGIGRVIRTRGSIPNSAH